MDNEWIHKYYLWTDVKLNFLYKIQIFVEIKTFKKTYKCTLSWNKFRLWLKCIPVLWFVPLINTFNNILFISRLKVHLLSIVSPSHLGHREVLCKFIHVFVDTSAKCLHLNKRVMIHLTVYAHKCTFLCVYTHHSVHFERLTSTEILISQVGKSAALMCRIQS